MFDRVKKWFKPKAKPAPVAPAAPAPSTPTGQFLFGSAFSADWDETMKAMNFSPTQVGETIVWRRPGSSETIASWIVNGRVTASVI